MANTTKLHTVDSLIDKSGNRQIFYNQNTINDVKVADDQDETIVGHLNYYAECSTAADDATKAIGVIGGDHDVLKPGATFDITFTNGNTAADPSLVVNNGTEFRLDGITETTIKAGQTFSFIFDGTKFISKGSSSSGTEIKKDTVTGDTETEEGSDKYVALVDGAESNATIKFDENIVVNKEGLKAPIANSTVKFEDATAEANTDYRTSSPLTSEESVATGFQKLKKILAGLGALAFKPSVGTTELDTTLSAAYNNRVSKSDLYNGTDYATAGEKALDAKAGATLQNSITSLNSKITSFENTKSSITGSALGSALSMTSSTSWSDIVTKIKGVSNQGAKTSSLNCGGSYTIPAGYHNGSGKITANSLSSQTSATASAANILTGKTAYVNGSKITGTMKNYSSVTQTAVTTTNDQTKTCYQVNNGYIAVVPAVGYWGSWDFTKSIRVPTSSTLKHIEGWVNASTSTYGWQWQNGSGDWNTANMNYLTITFNFSHRVVTASAYHENYGNNQHIVGTNGHEYQLGRTSIIQTQKTHPNMMTDTYFYIAVDISGGRYHYDIWYI